MPRISRYAPGRLTKDLSAFSCLFTLGQLAAGALTNEFQTALVARAPILVRFGSSDRAVQDGRRQFLDGLASPGRLRVQAASEAVVNVDDYQHKTHSRSLSIPPIDYSGSPGSTRLGRQVGGQISRCCFGGTGLQVRPKVAEHAVADDREGQVVLIEADVGEQGLVEVLQQLPNPAWSIVAAPMATTSCTTRSHPVFFATSGSIPSLRPPGGSVSLAACAEMR